MLVIAAMNTCPLSFHMGFFYYLEAGWVQRLESGGWVAQLYVFQNDLEHYIYKEIGHLEDHHYKFNIYRVDSSDEYRVLILDVNASKTIGPESFSLSLPEPVDLQAIVDTTSEYVVR